MYLPKDGQEGGGMKLENVGLYGVLGKIAQNQ